MEFPHGRVFVPSMLEDDVLRLLAPDTVVDGGQNWLMSVVYDFSRQAGLDPDDPDQALPEPKAWNAVTAVDDWPTGRLPAVLIITGESLDDPERGPDGYYTETVRLDVVIVDSARTFWDAKRNAGIYGAAVRQALAAHLLDLPDPVANVAGILAGRSDPRPLPTRDPERTDIVAGCLVGCRVVINDSLTDTVDITTPPVTPDATIEDVLTVKTDGAIVAVNADD